MKFFLVPTAGTSKRGRVASLESQGVWWARFGNDSLVYAAESKVGAARKSLDGAEPAGSIRKGNMHLVVQKGRTFQREHPDVRVILDKGRYLVVDIPPKQAKALAGRRDPCFHIENLRENTVVFDAPEVRRVAPRAEYAQIANALSQSSFEAKLAHLVSFPTRHSTSSHYRTAADWAQQQLQSYGLSAILEPINVGSTPSWNVKAIKPGTAAAPERVLVVAHLDSINTAGGATAAAPGADDNASGSAGLLALAEAITGYQFAHDLVFILFGGEEQGLHGSQQYVASLDPADRERIRAVVNMDMIGHVNTAPETVLLEGAAVSQGVIDGLAAAAGQFTTLNVQTALNPHSSDHVSFIDAGIPAVLTIEGADGANDQIHTAGDVLARVDAAYATQILKMNAGYIAATAEVSATAGAGAPSPDPQPAPCADCGDRAVAAETAQAVNLLKTHYQMLFAQYTRLQQSGRMTGEDIANWYAAQEAYQRLTGGAAQPPPPVH